MSLMVNFCKVLVIYSWSVEVGYWIEFKEVKFLGWWGRCLCYFFVYNFFWKINDFVWFN